MKKILLLAVLASVLPVTASAERLYSAGFELQSATNNVEYVSDTNVSAMDTTTFRSGAASLRTNPSASTQRITHRFRTDATTRFYARFYLRIASAPAATTNIFIYGDGTFNPLIIKLTTGRQLQLFNDTVQLGSNSSALSTNTWYCVQIDYNDASGDAVSVYAEQDTCSASPSAFASGTLSDVGGGGQISLGVLTSTTADLYFDDVAVNDTTGSNSTSLPGEGRITHIRPDGSAGDTNPPTGSCADVDETTPDDATTFADLDTTGEAIECSMGSSSGAGIDSYDTVKFVQVGVRIREEASAATGYGSRIKSASGGTTSENANVDAGSTTWLTNPNSTTGFRAYLLSYTDPTTGAAWTPTGTNSLDNMQVGADTSTNNDIDISTLWALVEFVDGTAPAGGEDDTILEIVLMPPLLNRCTMAA